MGDIISACEVAGHRPEIGNDMGFAGMGYIRQALEKNTAITDIDLGGTRWAMNVCGAWRARVRIKHDKMDNNIGAGGAERIAQALEMNTTITKINMSRRMDEYGVWRMCGV